MDEVKGNKQDGFVAQLSVLCRASETVKVGDLVRGQPVDKQDVEFG